MLCFPNCKINLGLYVTAKRSDGYHDLETVFFPLMVQDVLEVIPAAKTAMRVTGLPVAGDATDNLVWKAYTMLQQQFPAKIPQLEILLHKVIPMGAGLGGGSADGAFMLQLLNDYCTLELDKPALAAMALTLGSDCPFFVYNTPQFATGRGEKMTPVNIDLSAYSIQLICPEVHVSTRDAFSNINPRPAPFNLAGLGTLPVPEWRDSVANDFEATVFAKHPELAAIKAQLYAQGAIYAAMSGTGSAIFGIFKKGGRAVVQSDIPFREVYLLQ